MADETTIGREPEVLVELHQDFCQETYGIAPCTAALGTTGVRKCHNTRATCQDPANYNPAPKILRFGKPRIGERGDQGYVLPFLVDVTSTPTKLNPGGGGEKRSVLGTRANIDVTFKDAPHTDRLVDKYRTERISGAAQTDEGGYDPFDRGTFWAKWLERNPYYQNRLLRVIEGYRGQALASMRTRDYFIERIEGPDSNGRVSLRAKDVLKLADDKRAQAPVQSPGILEFAVLESETSSFTVIGAVLADYDSPSGLVRIGDEIIEYTSLVENSGQLTFSGAPLIRGARNTLAADHDQDDYVQRCIEYSAVPCWDVVEDLLLNYANVPAQYIPSADWDTEGSSWLSAFNISAVLSEPEGVTTLITEIEEQCQFFIWWDEFDQEIKLRALRPAAPAEFIGTINDREHILENSLSIKKDTEKRVSQVWIYYDRFNPTERLDELNNYRQVRVSADLEAENSEQYGESRIRKIFSRWLTNDGQALQVASRLLSRFRDNPRTLSLKLDAKDRAIKTGDVIDVETRVVLDATGKPKTFRYQVTSFKDDPPGEAVMYELLEYFTGRFGFIGPNGLPDYSAATETQRNQYAWIAPDTGKFSDGTEAYKII